MLQPPELASDRPWGLQGCRGRDVWAVMLAAAEGNAAGLELLLARHPALCQAEYDYIQPLHLAVREGHGEAVRLLLEAGADASALGRGEDLTTTARDRGHETIAQLLEEAGARGLDGAPAAEAEIHRAAEAEDLELLRTLLDSDPTLIESRDRQGGTPLHRAVAASARGAVEQLVARGADVHARHDDGPGSERGYAAAGFEPIDLAFWDGPFWGVREDLATARLLLAAGAARDLPIAAALGDLEAAEALLEEDPGGVDAARPCGKRALSTAVERGHETIAHLLLEHGADPSLPEGGTAPRGVALYAAARTGHRPLVEALLAHGADPNSWIDSSGSATYAAATPELRALLIEHGGRLDPYDLLWLGEDDEALARIAAEPATADAGCGGVLAAACALGKPRLLERLLAAGVRVPPQLTACRTYLLRDPAMLRRLLASGMDPNLPSWQRVTPLHDLCGRDGRGRPLPHREAAAEILLTAGASLTARDEEYRSTPLAWAAREGLDDMAELLLARGASPALPDDELWATPLAWATRRGHEVIARRLRRAGAAS